MQVYQGLEEFEKVNNAVVTTGTFDGVHLGHRKILNRLRETADKMDGETVIFTFHPHPRMVLFPESNQIKLINTIGEKIELLREIGVNHLIIQPFTKEFSRVSATEYVRDILINKIGTKKLVIGYDHRFGKNREGSLEHLIELSETYDFEVEEIPALDIDEVKVSSTKIRNAILEGNVETAREYLNYEYRLTGKVIHGEKLGNKIGYPTANISPSDEHKLIPANGVYAVRILYGNSLKNGMLNIGNRPTVDDSGKRKIEVHIFDFNEMIYDQELTLCFVSRLRDEKKFNSLDDLKKAIDSDKKEALKCLQI